MRNEVYFKEWRKIKNAKGSPKPILVPFRKDYLENGTLTMEHCYTEIRLNSGLGDALFAKPEGPAFTPPPGAKAKKKAAPGKR